MAKQIAVDIRRKELRDFIKSRMGTGRNTPIQYLKEIKRKEPERQRVVQEQRQKVNATPESINATKGKRKLSETKATLQKAFQRATK